jgi:magnesium transporter
MLNPLLLPEIRSLLAEGDEAGLRAIVEELHPASVAEFAEGLTTEETWELLRFAPLSEQAEIFPFFVPSKQVQLVEGAGRDHIAQLIEAMSHDDRVDLVKSLDPEVVDEILPLVAKADREDIRKLFDYAEDSAGSVMTTDYAWLEPGLVVEEAIRRVREQAPERETIYYIYVVDDQRHLVGVVSLRDLILSKSRTRIEDIMQTSPISARADEDQESVAQRLAEYDLLAIPVVDSQDRLVGIITHDDVIDVLSQEATEDALHLAAVGAMEENYLEVPFGTVWRKRAVWLSCLFGAELFTFTALAHFEEAIATVLVLSLFVPLCISTGGNSGSQAATLITRALALGQVQVGDWLRVLRHEVGMGIVLGLTLGLIGFVRAVLTPQEILGTTDRWTMALVISQAVALICLWGTLIGSMLPLAFKRLGLDPGYASSPFVATFVDVTGIIIYFSIAEVWLL